MSRPNQAIVALLALALAAGCSSTRDYAGPAEKNLQVRTTAVGAKVAMGVHALDAQGNAHYEGTVYLDQPVVDVGLPPGRATLLVFAFRSSGLFSGNSSIQKEVKLVPRPGRRYEARVTYRDALYDVELTEIRQ